MMALSPDQVPGVASRVLAMREREQYRLRRISDYMRGYHDSVYVPNGAKQEYRWLLQRSVVNFLPLVVAVIAENLHVDGYLPTNPEGEVSDPAAAGSGTAKQDPANPWSIWHANRMQARQHGLHRAVAKYGIAYTVVLPGEMQAPDGGTVPQPVIRAVSPRRITALYADDVDDEWPVYAVEERALRNDKGAIRVVYLYDDNCRYTLIGKQDDPRLYWASEAASILGAGWEDIPSGMPTIEEHGLGVCPVVRYLHDIDLDGEMDVSGVVEPLIPLQDQINTTTFNLLMAQQYASFRQRWVAGMVPDDEDGRPREPFRSGVDRLWVAEDDTTKFGEFGQTDLAPILDSREASIRHMSTVSQVPPYHLLGQIANLSAEALAAARDGLDRAVGELESILSEPHKQTFRLAGLAAGNKAAWEDRTSTVVWRDTSARAFAATADALGKVAQMLGVPATELWSRIPGVSAEEVARWKEVAESQGALAELNRMLEAQMTHGAQTAGPPTQAEPFQAPALGRTKGI
jgi:Phage portal protein, SPP1 Gp6-like